MSPITTSIRLSELDKNANLSNSINTKIQNLDSEFILLIDDRDCSVQLKKDCVKLMQLALGKNTNAGMVYADYELIDNNKVTEIHLLKHHIGRVRDNQDYGKAFMFRKSVLKQVGGFDSEIECNQLYDIRLKISEIAEIIHISNKTHGSLYIVEAIRESANIFDYLLSDTDVQKEAEFIITNHLKRMNAYLSPKQIYKKRPDTEKYPLKASIIIPVNNRPDFIIEAIESGQNQTIQNIEIIAVVNGGEDDPTNNAVKCFMKGGDRFNSSKPEVRLITSDINNIGFCLNLGVQLAQGEYYIQLDSDDQLLSNAVEMILEKFDSDPTLGMVIGSYEVWQKLDNGKIQKDQNIPVVSHKEWTDENGRNNLLRINGAGAPRAIPIQLIKEIGYFEMNENPYTRNYGEDYDMVLRISEHYKIGRIYEPLYNVIRHSGGTDHSIDQITIDRNNEAKDWMRKTAIIRRQELNNGR